MDRSKVAAVVDEHLLPLAGFLFVGDWKIDVEFGHIEGGGPDGCFRMTCKRMISYKHAIIHVDPEQFNGDDIDILDCLFHEMAHVVHSPFDLFYEAAAEAYGFGSEESPLISSLRRVWSHCCEETVKNLEWSWSHGGWRDAYLDRMTRPESRS
jgi:hypothetical protein